MKRIPAKGFTLTELLVTLAVVIILALVSIPMITTIIQNHRLAYAAENLYTRLQYARAQAIQTNSTVYVSFTTGDSWCYGINAGSACSCGTPSGCSLGTASAAQAGLLTLSTTGLSSNTVNFESSHAAANSSGTVTLTLYGKSSPLITVSISRMGNLQLCSTGISGYTAC